MIEEQREPGEKRLVTSSGARPKPRSATQANSKQSASKAAQVAKANELAAKSVAAGAPARQLAAEVLQRIDTEGAYANLLLPAMLERSHLETRDRGFVTELVYGTTRMRRSCDWLIDRFVINELDAQARAFLRINRGAVLRSWFTQAVVQRVYEEG